jgi:hypothetical protein
MQSNHSRGANICSSKLGFQQAISETINNKQSAVIAVHSSYFVPVTLVVLLIVCSSGRQYCTYCTTVVATVQYSST